MQEFNAHRALDIAYRAGTRHPLGSSLQLDLGWAQLRARAPIAFAQGCGRACSLMTALDVIGATQATNSLAS
ncbi:hypothetical protein DXZ75_04865 [Streptomyces sp. AcE210]|nr:hypothetical protein DXZ75_04865 [Streptomyces sp. AcE210]